MTKILITKVLSTHHRSPFPLSAKHSSSTLILQMVVISTVLCLLTLSKLSTSFKTSSFLAPLMILYSKETVGLLFVFGFVACFSAQVHIASLVATACWQNAAQKTQIGRRYGVLRSNFIPHFQTDISPSPNRVE